MSTTKIRKDEMSDLGLPDWMIERVTTCCVNCDYWKNECQAPTMICKVGIERNEHAYPYFVFDFTIRFWMTIQKIRFGIK